MLLLRCELDGRSFALPAVLIHQVLARVPLREVVGGPEWLEGVFDLGEQIVPVLDLGRLLAGRPASDRLNTRMVLIDRPGSISPLPEGWMALVVERADQLVHVSDEQVESASFGAGSPLGLGPVVRLDHQLVQLVDPQRLAHLLDGQTRDFVSLPPSERES